MVWIMDFIKHFDGQLEVILAHAAVRLIGEQIDFLFPLLTSW